MVTDPASRRRLVQVCREARPPVACLLLSDPADALVAMSAAPGSLVVVERSMHEHGLGWLASLHRLRPADALLQLDARRPADLQRLRRVLSAARVTGDAA